MFTCAANNTTNIIPTACGPEFANLSSVVFPLTAYLVAIHAPNCVAILVFAARSASEALDLSLALFTTSYVARDFEESTWNLVGTVNAVGEEDTSEEKQQQADLVHEYVRLIP